MQVWSVYIIRCGDDSLYTGITTELARRLREHGGEGAAGAKYLRGRGPLQLVYSCAAGSRGEALRIERRLKKLPRKKKDMLIAGDISIDALRPCADD
jgi:putative endonuclease